MVWKSTQKLGVGKATASDGSSFVVARYFPAGNITNQGHFENNVLPAKATTWGCPCHQHPTWGQRHFVSQEGFMPCTATGVLRGKHHFWPNKEPYYYLEWILVMGCTQAYVLCLNLENRSVILILFGISNQNIVSFWNHVRLILIIYISWDCFFFFINPGMFII